MSEDLKQFIPACQSGDAETVNNLLKSIMELEEGEKLQREILKYGNYIDDQNKQYGDYGAFRLAAGGGHMQVVNYLLEVAKELEADGKQLQLEMLEADDYGAFRLAAMGGHMQVVKNLFEIAGKLENEKQLQLKMLQCNSCKAFISAAEHGKEEVVDYLLTEAGKFGKEGKQLQLEMLKYGQYKAFILTTERGYVQVMDRLLKAAEKLKEEEEGLQFGMLEYSIREGKVFTLAIELCYTQVMSNLFKNVGGLGKIGEPLRSEMLEVCKEKLISVAVSKKADKVSVVNSIFKVVEELEEGKRNLLHGILKELDKRDFDFGPARMSTYSKKCFPSQKKDLSIENLRVVAMKLLLEAAKKLEEGEKLQLAMLKDAGKVFISDVKNGYKNPAYYLFKTAGKLGEEGQKLQLAMLEDVIKECISGVNNRNLMDKIFKVIEKLGIIP